MNTLGVVAWFGLVGGVLYVAAHGDRIVEWLDVRLADAYDLEDDDVPQGLAYLEALDAMPRVDLMPCDPLTQHEVAVLDDLEAHLRSP